ncbi:flagellar protein FlgJ [Selenomonas ruminantium]|uniref:Flagellar protein FlgJ n=1 Tax=Selenomonas ruminantium TaxID=971 RepID=A0A1M6TBG7_SELRU|nr:rod-binding protein [Selenomonas ruminantium]SHK54310.1 flagellar protein FlgJ [Selenomonas ruminantium]
MQIEPLSAQGLGTLANNNYDSARASAESAEFADMLKELQGKTTAAANSKGKNIMDDAAMAKRDKELKEACEGFEAMFLNMMYRQMRATVPEDSLFGESHGQKIFQDMRDDELMKKVAAGGGIGIADMMYKQLKPQVLKANQQVAQKSEM